MINNRSFRHLVLIGMMGTGKTTIGKLIAEQYNLPFVDLDKEIEIKNKITIKEIFATFGEEYFRMLETEELQFVLKKQNSSVIATGGGIVLKEINKEMMLHSGFIVHLTAEYESIIKRLVDDQTRPLLTGDIAIKLKKIIDERAGLYDFADIKIHTDKELTIQEIRKSIYQDWVKYNPLITSEQIGNNNI